METHDLPPPVGYVCAVTDPDGNVVEISHDQGVYATVQRVWGDGGSVFTGIVEELGRYEERDGERVRFGASVVLDDVGLGDSIAVNGACLTVVDVGDGGGRPTSATRP